MKMQSFWGSICLINLVLGAAQGCESDEMEFEPTAMETISIPISNAPEPSETGGMIESEPGDTAQDAEQTAISGGAEADEYGNCIIDDGPTACPDTKGEVKRAPILLPELEKYVNDPSCKSEMIDLSIVLDDALKADDFKLSDEDNAEFPNIKDTFNLIFSYMDGKEYLNGMELTEELSEEFTRLMAVKRNHVVKQIYKKRSGIIDNILKTGIKIDSEALETYRNSNMSLKIQYDRCKINDLLKIPSLLGIRIAQQPTNSSLATAMQATGIAQAMSSQPNASYGNNTGIYVTDMNCASPGYLSRYLRLDNLSSWTDEVHNRNITSIIRSVSPDAYIYCREWCKLPQLQDLSINSIYTPRIAVAAFPCNICGTGYREDDRDADDFVLHYNIPFVAAAGNIDNTCTGTYVRSIGKGLNVNTVGNYNDNLNTPSLFRIHPTSRYGDPETHNFKPEVSAPGTDINAGINTDGSSITMSGTSQATAHVAALLANIASGFSDTSRFTAALARARLLASAHDVTIYNPDGSSNSFDRAGLGGVHYSRLKNPSFYTWFEGNFYDLAHNDPYPNNNYIDQQIQIGSNVNILRLYFVWLNSGTWAFKNWYHPTNTTHPMGRRFTVYLYNPNGTYMTQATNYYNGFVQLESTITMSGTYLIRISLSENLDNGSIQRTALAGYYY